MFVLGPKSAPASQPFCRLVGGWPVPGMRSGVGLGVTALTLAAPSPWGRIPQGGDEMGRRGRIDLQPG